MFPANIPFKQVQTKQLIFFLQFLLLSLSTTLLYLTGDMRQRALCDEHSKMFEVTEDTADRSFFSEIIASISDVKFAGENGRYIVSRDYLTLKIWDIHMESRPVKTIQIHEHLRSKLCDLYENDVSIQSKLNRKRE